MLIERLNRLPKEVLGRVKFIGSVADEMHMNAYVVGGFVRDLLLGAKNNFDLDIVVEGDGIAFARELSGKLNGRLAHHKAFGTATVVAQDNSKIDIATARKEIYEFPAALPKVTPGAIKDDLGRRDFSINAMAFGINKNNFGQLIDFYAGNDDLKAKKVRALHDLSFIDDPTRILRAARFAERCNFKISPYTLNLIKQAVSHKMPEKVSPHRLRDELILILKENEPVKCVKLVEKICGFSFLHPRLVVDQKKISSLEKAAKVMKWFEDNFRHKRKVDKWLVYLMLLLEDLPAAEIRKTADRFAFRSGEIKRMLSFKADCKRAILKLKSELKPSDIHCILDPLSYEVILLILLRANNRSVEKNINNFLHHYNEVRILVGGEDVKKLGIKPGPHFKKLLKQTFHAKLDKGLKTKEEELEFLRRKAKR